MGPSVEVSQSLALARDKAAALRAEISKDPVTSPTVGLDESGALQVSVLTRDLARREASAAERERRYEESVEELEAAIVAIRREVALGPARGEQDEEARMDPVYGLHGEVMERVGEYERRSEAVVRERESELARACRARMADSTKELAELMQRKEASVLIWKQRAELLKKEKRWATDLCAQLEAHNDELKRDNLELQASFRQGEAERRRLVTMLAQTKKDSGRCHRVEKHLDDRLAAAAAASSLGGPGDLPPGPHASPDSSSTAPATTAKAPPRRHRASARADSSSLTSSRGDSRLKRREELKHLERLLDHQQKRLATLRAACVMDAEESVALQRLLRQRVIDVSARLRGLPGAAHDATERDPPLRPHAAGPDDQTCASSRDCTLERAQLAWETRVLTLLYEKTFPPRLAAAGPRPDRR